MYSYPPECEPPDENDWWEHARTCECEMCLYERGEMSVATPCEVCEAWSPAYTTWPSCRECVEYVCLEHCVPGSVDDEHNKCLCVRCQEQE
jgi:hypothetical protein